jgi:hypothetical protein
MKKLTLLIACFFLTSITHAAKSAPEEKQNVKYRKSKKINFETLLIEGQNQKGDLDVITGNVGDDGDGLLKLRKNFLDQIAVDAGEKVK